VRVRLGEFNKTVPVSLGPYVPGIRDDRPLAAARYPTDPETLALRRKRRLRAGAGQADRVVGGAGGGRRFERVGVVLRR
jgi:hypothetical protein